MSGDKLTLNLSCLKCGGIPMSDDELLTDASVVKCKSCGQIFGTYAEVKTKAMETAKKHVADKFKNIFKR